MEIESIPEVIHEYELILLLVIIRKQYKDEQLKQISWEYPIPFFFLFSHFISFDPIYIDISLFFITTSFNEIRARISKLQCHNKLAWWDVKLHILIYKMKFAFKKNEELRYIFLYHHSRFMYNYQWIYFVFFSIHPCLTPHIQKSLCFKNSARNFSQTWLARV